MKELGIQSLIQKKIYKHKFKPSKIAENILDRDFIANKPLEKIYIDITYILISKDSRKFFYLNSTKDLFNGEIVAYDISPRNDTLLVRNTIDKL